MNQNDEKEFQDLLAEYYKAQRGVDTAYSFAEYNEQDKNRYFAYEELVEFVDRVAGRSHESALDSAALDEQARLARGGGE